MTTGINKALLIGNVGKKVEVLYTPNGTAVVRLDIATGHRYKTDNGVETIVTWHKVLLYNKLAEIAGQYLQVGSKVYIEGRTTHRTYTDKAGIKRSITEVIA